MSPWRKIPILVFVETDPWDILENPNRLMRRWRRGIRSGKLMPMRVDGRDLLVNPRQIRWMTWQR